MSTVIPEGEGIRKAVKWIDEARKDTPDRPLMKLIDEAGMAFNLAPKDTEFLIRFFSKKD